MTLPSVELEADKHRQMHRVGFSDCSKFLFVSLLSYARSNCLHLLPDLGLFYIHIEKEINPTSFSGK